MTKFLRYALTTFCFAASVGCLGLWRRSYTVYEQIYCQSPISSDVIYFSAFLGAVYIGPADARTVAITWRYAPRVIADMDIPADAGYGPTQFGWYGTGYHFPLWYPALIFALAGVGVLRFRRQFSIRSALVATTVVAALVGMAVIL
jgi:hypothetical protein